MLSEKAFAKINLILTLRGKRDGLHLIDSVFYLTDLADHLTLEITDKDSSLLFRRLQTATAV